MKMVVHNKYTTSLRNLCKEVEKKEILAKEIQLTPKEAFFLMKELNTNFDELKKDYVIVQVNDINERYDSHIKLLLGGKELSTEKLKQIVERWYKGEFDISFMGVKLRVMNQKRV